MPEASGDPAIDGVQFQVTLDNCEREPIHVPGSIQPGGALLAFEPGSGRVEILVQAPGFVDEELLLDETKPFSRLIQLRPQPLDKPLSSPVVPVTGAPGEAKDKDPAPGDSAATGTSATEPPRTPSRTGDGPTATATPPTRVPGEPGVKPTRQPGSPWPKRIGPGRSSEGILTDEKIQIIH